MLLGLDVIVVLAMLGVGFSPRLQLKFGKALPVLAIIAILLSVAIGAYIGAALMVGSLGYYGYKHHQAHAALNGPETPPELGGGDDSPTGS